MSTSEFSDSDSLPDPAKVPKGVYDRLNRWQKYAWGCSEMVFNPLRHWFTRSPFSSLYRTFLRGPAPLAFKLSCTSYISSYWLAPEPGFQMI